MGNYSEYLLDEFRKWEKSTKRRQSVSSFARYLGVKQASLSRWMNGDNPPDTDNVKRIAVKLGFEIFNILGYTDGKAEEWASLYEIVPEDMRDELISLMRDWLHAKGLDGR